MVGIIRDFRFLEPVRASFLFWLGSNRESRIESHTPIQITNVTGKKAISNRDCDSCLTLLIVGGNPEANTRD